MDHLVIQRRHTNVLWILKGDPSTRKFTTVYWTLTGLGEHLTNTDTVLDRMFAFDFEHSGKMDHICLQRAGTRQYRIFRNEGGIFSAVFIETKGLGGYPGHSLADRAFAFDYESSGKRDYICLYQSGLGLFWIVKHTGSTFTPVYQNAPGTPGIAGWQNIVATDKAFAYDYNHTSKMDHRASWDYCRL